MILSKIGKLGWMCIAALVFLSATPRSTIAQQAQGAGKQTDLNTTVTGAKTAKDSSQRTNPTLSDFAWLEGKWQGTWGPRIVEQIWTGPKGGEMEGIFRAIENDKVLVIEMFSLSETPDGIELRLRHFTPTLVPWEKSAATMMKLADVNSRVGVFENPAEGQPQREIFTRIDPDTFSFRSELAASAGDTAHVTEIRYHRQK